MCPGPLTYRKKVRSVCWKAAMGQGPSGKAAWRWARTCAAGWWAGLAGRRGGRSGGGQRHDRQGNGRNEVGDPFHAIVLGDGG